MLPIYRLGLHIYICCIEYNEDVKLNFITNQRILCCQRATQYANNNFISQLLKRIWYHLNIVFIYYICFVEIFPHLGPILTQNLYFRSIHDLPLLASEIKVALFSSWASSLLIIVSCDGWFIHEIFHCCELLNIGHWHWRKWLVIARQTRETRDDESFEMETVLAVIIFVSRLSYFWQI